MIRFLYVFFSLLALSLVSSCDDTTSVDPLALLTDRDKLHSKIGFTWLNGSINNYSPKDSISNLIESVFDSSKHKFVIFMEPECSCKPLVVLPAYVFKIFDIANISTKYYEIYVANSVLAPHSYENIFKIDKLPFVVLLTSGSKAYSILDTFDFLSKRINNYTLEDAILDALKK